MSRYSTGWRSATQDTKASKENSCIQSQDFRQIRDDCLAQGILWEDPTFPANYDSLLTEEDNFEWMRPGELCDDPHMFVGGHSRSDIVQGELGNCWLLAAMGALCTVKSEELLHRIIPNDNSFQRGNYAGVFHFKIWHHGEWLDIVIDDRLPTRGGQLQFVHSPTNNEFWPALLEKAYAKLQGSYEAVKGGMASEAMTDFTGGACEVYEFRKEVPKNFFKVLLKSLERQSLMCTNVDTSVVAQNTKLDNGLVTGHAYTITDVKEIPVRGQTVQLVRIRNPWGDDAEWNGAWSDGSKEWNMLSDREKSELGLVFEDDGEFWISYNDFLENFDDAEICLLAPGTLSEARRQRWSLTQEVGSWVKKVNAGGCKNFKDTFWTNPQYRISVHDRDDDSEDTGTVIVSLMQTDARRNGQDLLYIGYTIYRIPSMDVPPLDKDFFRYNRPTVVVRPTNRREKSGRHSLEPGDYVVVPSTFKPDQEANFLLRIFSHKKVTSYEIDEPTGLIAPDPQIAMEGRKQAENDDRSKVLKSLFARVAGEDQEICAYELKDLLNSHFKNELGSREFSLECCRSMVAMMDADRSGKLGYQEFRRLWRDLHKWKAVFTQFDQDKNGTFNSHELRQALNFAGISVANATFSTLVMRYSDKDGKINFDDFIQCAVKIKTMFEIYRQMDGTVKQPAQLTLDQFIQTTMYA